jgi:uncharacterized protein YqhQ
MTELLGIMLVTVVIVVVVIVAVALYIIHYLLVRLPEQQRSILERFSLIVANQVAFEYSTLSEKQQKQVAEEKMKDILESMNVLIPDSTQIEAAIASAQYRVKQEQATVKLEQLRDEIIRMQVGNVETVIELPITPVEKELWIL